MPRLRTILMHTSLKVKSSKGKVIRPITAETESVSHVQNGKTHELQNWYAMKSVKGRWVCSEAFYKH